MTTPLKSRPLLSIQFSLSFEAALAHLSHIETSLPEDHKQRSEINLMRRALSGIQHRLETDLAARAVGGDKIETSDKPPSP